MQYNILLMVLMTLTLNAQAQNKIMLYEGEIPNATKQNLSEADIPVLFKYEVEGAKEAVLVIPGGGYGMVAIDHEGHDIAKAFNKQGYSAFVLRYRLPKDSTMLVRKIGPLQDAQRGMQFIRENYNFAKVGVIGFSAGGHLTASLSNHYDDLKIENSAKVSLRPDFSILVYPVISMTEEITHKGSKHNLIGQAGEERDIDYFSLEKQVTAQTPPSFLVHAADDKAVVIENTWVYVNALKKQGVKNEVFTYETGGHGFGLVNKTDDRKWEEALFKWLKTL